MRTLTLAALIALFAVVGAASAQTGKPTLRPLSEIRVHTPKPGSRERGAILDTLRVPIQGEIKRPIRFRPTIFRVQGDWAFVDGTLLGTDDKPLSLRGTRWEADIREGGMSRAFTGLLHRIRGKWVVVASDWGATDVVWEAWAKKYKAPTAIFPKLPGA